MVALGILFHNPVTGVGDDPACHIGGRKTPSFIRKNPRFDCESAGVFPQPRLLGQNWVGRKGQGKTAVFYLMLKLSLSSFAPRRLNNGGKLR
jgi:hypothetical protein